MDGLTLTLTANAGVILEGGGRVVLVDALHREKVRGFSTLSPRQSEQLLDYFSRRQPDLCLTTHLHPDHYSASLLARARERWPDCVFFGPDAGLTGPGRFVPAGIPVDAALLPHDGKEYAHVVNYGYFLTLGDCSILFPGDCATTAASALGALAAGRRVDLAVLNFPWLCLPHARAAVREVISPRAVALVHLPLPEDDLDGFRPAAFRAAGKLPGVDVRVLGGWMERAAFSFPR